MKTTVLIVDDSITVRMDLKETFESAGFETHLCATVEAARSICRQRAFDLAILDVVLPDGDGLELLQELKASPMTAAMPILLLSTEAEVRDRVRGLRTGADDYVGKPYDAAQIVGRAREIMRKRTHPRERPLILLIEDSITFAGELREALEAQGYDVALGRSGEEGLQLAADLKPDLAIIDQIMPGCDGSEVIRRLRADAALRRLPCLLLTASDRREDELRALAAGADAYLQKDTGIPVIIARMTALRRSAPSPAPGPTVTSLHAPKRILVVDDNTTFREEACDHLRLEGYDMVAAASGEQALELLGSQSVDGIVLDLIMPGISGQETCRRIKADANWRNTPLIIMSAMEEAKAMIESINAGADDYIAKTGDFEILKARLHAQLRRRQFEDENRRIHEELHRHELEAIELQAVKELAQTRADLVAQLEAKNGELIRANAELRRAKEGMDVVNKELESFSYSVSHDLKAPLRAINGFGELLAKRASAKLDEQESRYLRTVQQNGRHMERLIEDMLSLARVTRQQLRREQVNLGSLAREICDRLQETSPRSPAVILEIDDNLSAQGDVGMLRILLENLLGNAWKFTGKCEQSRISLRRETAADGEAYVIRDNGAGFDMQYADKLFGTFQRLHSDKEFPGTGVGLATVARVIRRHGGTIRAEGKVGVGAAFYFTLG
ncbi:MAG TPA: response regulator [Phycisphaerae bacterium]|nr:response regulator [Phycisphaerae bacterium]